MIKTFVKILIQAVIACAIFGTIGFIINAVRSDGLPLIADKPYEIFVPCPITQGTVELISPNDSRLTDGNAYIVDARAQEDYDAWHYKDAICITYDYLDPIEEAELKNITINIAASGKARLVVYGDENGQKGSNGYELGRELAGHGLKNVFIVEGSIEALKGSK